MVPEAREIVTLPSSRGLLYYHFSIFGPREVYLNNELKKRIRESAKLGNV